MPVCPFRSPSDATSSMKPTSACSALRPAASPAVRRQRRRTRPHRRRMDLRELLLQHGHVASVPRRWRASATAASTTAADHRGPRRSARVDAGPPRRAPARRARARSASRCRWNQSCPRFEFVGSIARYSSSRSSRVGDELLDVAQQHVRRRQAADEELEEERVARAGSTVSSQPSSAALPVAGDPVDLLVGRALATAGSAQPELTSRGSAA